MNDAQRTVDVRTGTPYRVHIGPGVLARTREFIESSGGGPAVVLTDANVAPLYREGLGLEAPTITVPAGEETKSFVHLERVLDFMAQTELDRKASLIALGGGVIGDLGGFAASLYMRGIAVVQCPTTLLSQVDSSVGGKTAVNLGAGKNLAGTFHQPAAVFADTSTLASLEIDEYRSGLGEVIKSALIGDADLFALLERETPAVMERDPALLGEIVERSVRVKADIVQRDEKETGDRKKLNLGHTFAHAIEHVAGYGTIPHGIAVGVGLQLALTASQSVGRLTDDELCRRTHDLLDALGLASDLDSLRQRYGVDLSADELAQAMRLDKKGSAGTPRFVLAAGSGDLAFDCELDPKLVRELFR